MPINLSPRFSVLWQSWSRLHGLNPCLDLRESSHLLLSFVFFEYDFSFDWSRSSLWDLVQISSRFSSPKEAKKIVCFYFYFFQVKIFFLRPIPAILGFGLDFDFWSPPDSLLAFELLVLPCCWQRNLRHRGTLRKTRQIFIAGISGLESTSVRSEWLAVIVFFARVIDF